MSMRKKFQWVVLVSSLITTAAHAGDQSVPDPIQVETYQNHTHADLRAESRASLMRTSAAQRQQDELTRQIELEKTAMHEESKRFAQNPPKSTLAYSERDASQTTRAAKIASMEERLAAANATEATERAVSSTLRLASLKYLSRLLGVATLAYGFIADEKVKAAEPQTLSSAAEARSSLAVATPAAEGK